MKKRIAKAFIERVEYDYYAVCFDYQKSFCNGFFMGYGKTPKEAIKDFKEEMNFVRESNCFNEKVRKDFATLEFEYRIDFKSCLEYYSQFFSIKGLSKVTGISQKRLEAYIDGSKSLRPSTAERIKEGLLKFADDLKDLELN